MQVARIYRYSGAVHKSTMLLMIVSTLVAIGVVVGFAVMELVLGVVITVPMFLLLLFGINKLLKLQDETWSVTSSNLSLSRSGKLVAEFSNSNIVKVVVTHGRSPVGKDFLIYLDDGKSYFVGATLDGNIELLNHLQKILTATADDYIE